MRWPRTSCGSLCSPSRTANLIAAVWTTRLLAIEFDKLNCEFWNRIIWNMRTRTRIVRSDKSTTLSLMMIALLTLERTGWLAALDGTQDAPWTAYEESPFQSRRHRCDDDAMISACRHRCISDSRTSPSPRRAHRSIQAAALADSRSRHADSGQSRRSDTFRSSERCHDWWECSGHESSRRASQRPARSGLTGWDSRRSRPRRARDRESCRALDDSWAPARWGQSNWICPGCSPRRPRRRIRCLAGRRTTISRRLPLNCSFFYECKQEHCFHLDMMKLFFHGFFYPLQTLSH